MTRFLFSVLVGVAVGGLCALIATLLDHQKRRQRLAEQRARERAQRQQQPQPKQDL